MEEFNEGILPFLESSDIKYVDDGVPKSMSVDYFRNNFTRVTTNELLNIGQYSYYYQSSEFPELILRFRFSASAGVTIMMMAYNDFEKQMKTLEDF